MSETKDVTKFVPHDANGIVSMLGEKRNDMMKSDLLLGAESGKKAVAGTFTLPDCSDTVNRTSRRGSPEGLSSSF